MKPIADSLNVILETLTDKNAAAEKIKGLKTGSTNLDQMLNGVQLLIICSATALRKIFCVSIGFL
jgi:replicative DNA helicase